MLPFQMLRDLAAAGVRSDRTIMNADPAGMRMLEGCPEFTWHPELHPPQGTWIGGPDFRLEIHPSQSNLGPFKPEFEVCGLRPETLAWFVAQHYREAGIRGAKGEYGIIPHVDVPHPGVIQIQDHAEEIATLATKLIGEPGVTVEPRRVWHDGWVLVVS